MKSTALNAPLTSNTQTAIKSGQSANEDGLRTYLREVGHYPLLSEQETNSLAKLFQKNNDPATRHRLITANLRLVVKIALDFKKYWMPDFLDLVQEGNVGLAKAVKKFEPERGIKFSYYASFWIRSHIMKHLMDNKRLVKIGTTQNQRKLFFNLKKESRRLEAQGIKAEPENLAASLQVREKDVVEMKQRLNGSEISIDAPLGHDSETTRKELLQQTGPSAEEIVSYREIKSLVRDILDRHQDSFSQREKAILNQRLLNPDAQTLQDIAEQFQVSKERIRQIEIGLLAKLRTTFKEEIPDYRQICCQMN
ncbi:MAG TPA: RNA polymerase factor sigma-32 [Desulfobacteria bacterium]|nr:RNA polymerase factor sigma-32 [Desulfobacteria bacterium]